MNETLGDLWKEDFEKNNKLEDFVKISNKILNGCQDATIPDEKYTYTYQEKEYKYDPDSSSIAWAYYKTMYGDMIKGTKRVEIVGETKRIQGLVNYKKNGIKQEPYGDLELGKIALAGDCVFNFNEKKVERFKKLLKKDHDLQNKLRLCEKMHHSPYNFSLMPVTGGMNNQKQSLSGYDRPDVLLYAISKFYEKDMTELTEKTTEIYDRLIELQGELQIIQHRGITDLCAYHFLATIGSFENYMRIFYHLDLQREQYNIDEKLKKIDPKENNLNLDERLYIAMLTMGQQPIDNPEDLKAYMNLAIAYWKIQRSKYESLQYKKKLSDEDKADIAELLKFVISYCKSPSQP